MSVVAWDGKVMAADRQGTFGGCMPLPGCKVFEHDGVLYGSSGGIEDFNLYRDWVKAGKTGDPPTLQEVNFLVVENGQITLLTERLIPMLIEHPFYAIGGGADFAIGAMAAGANATQAVEIASRYHTGCGFGVEVLKPPRKKRTR